ncbi:MAG TPA: DUF2059 domain-containing protein [Caulobacteraceae bacterium]|jgi:hypothetical protein
MAIIRFLGGAVLAAAIAGGAPTATAIAADAAPSPSPEKMALARQLVEASGGANQLKAVLQTLFRGMSANVDTSLPADQKRLRDALIERIQTRIVAVSPELMESTVRVYAQNLTDQELRDYLAWLQSDSGRALMRKLPQITGDSVREMAPVLNQVTQGIRQDVVDEVCAQAKCTAHDKEVLAAMINKSVPKRPG